MIPCFAQGREPAEPGRGEVVNRKLILCVALIPLCVTAGARSEAIAGKDCSAVSGRVQQLAKIENTRNSSYHCLGIRMDDNANIVGVRFEKYDVVGNGGEQEERPPLAIREFTPAEIGTARGVVLDGTPQQEAVRLRGMITAGAAIAPLVVSYLHNGIVGEFRECNVTLEKDGAHRWRLVNAEHSAVSRIVVQTWTMPVLGTVGIETLQGICAPPATGR